MPYELNGIRSSKKIHTACVFLNGELLESSMLYRTAHGYPLNLWYQTLALKFGQGDNEYTK